MYSRLVAFFLLCFAVIGCQESDKPKPTLFKFLSNDSTGIVFQNTLKFNNDFNIYTYRNFYNGGGVGLGDINNDGLLDIYLNANQGPNKLFLNKGNLKFEDITHHAGVEGTKAWSTGVAMADVNGDGWLDIYVCNSGDVVGDNKENELFINNGDLTFTDKAREYGVADKGFTTHAVFFDYDRDGDLDLYILNNSYQAIGSFNLRKNERPKRDPLGGDKLMRNDGDHFVDVSDKAGIYGSVIGFGLGATVGDVNKDGWLDLYVSNDFFERDYLYLNKKDGTFEECLTKQMKSISGASMGADIADINNDGWPDIFVTEMLPQPNERLKTVTTFENWDRYQNSVINDYYHQFTRNTLQLNNGNSTFSEVSRLTGMEATDWSWGALMFDADNDGWKDVFVANGIYQDLTNQDYLQYISNEEVVRSIVANNQVDYKKLVELIPSNPVPDYFFKNQGGLIFKNVTKDWGLGTPNFSNGSAYGDLDNDGDLDLVINRVNEPAMLARNDNHQINPYSKYLKFKLIGESKNTFAIGTSIEIEVDGKRIYIEQVPNRGFESSVDPRPHVGVGNADTVDAVWIHWPSGKKTILKNIATNQTIELKESEADKKNLDESPEIATVFKQISITEVLHQESDFVDFDRDKLVYHMQSNEGPRMAVGDVDGDKREDFFIGGAKGQSGQLFKQTADFNFKKSDIGVFDQDQLSEDIESAFFDADGDGDIDLYVCSGSNEFSNVSNALADRLYFNNGLGDFTKSIQLLPTDKLENSSCVTAGDYDKDGDVDLFVGVRSESFSYGVPMRGYLLNNNGKGQFTDVTSTQAPALLNLGLITDALWVDADQDQDLDLVVAGEYLPIKIFRNDQNTLVDITNQAGLSKTSGWWNQIEAADLDDDGDVDFVVANHGLNSRFRASIEEPVTMFVNDFDRNGSKEQIICTYNGDKSYPMVLRHDLMAQIPALKKKYLKYENYKDQTFEDIFTEAERTNTLKWEAYELASGIVVNEGNGVFTFKQLPIEAQFSSMYAIKIFDFTGDGVLDILLGGNQYRVKPEAGRYDASYGALFAGDGKGNFEFVPPQKSGLVIHGEVRDFKVLNMGTSKVLMVARNNDTVLFYQIN